MYGRAVAEPARSHARDMYPEESCGLVVAGQYRPCRNIANSPREQFTVDPGDILAAEQVGRIDAVVHSHPDGPSHPTASDLTGQRKMGVPWGIVTVSTDCAGPVLWWGPGAPVAPLVGRQFVYNIWDCYTLIRDYYATEHAIALPDPPPTDFEWWKTDPSAQHYLHGFTDQGFYRISHADLQPGDGFLAQIHSPAVNHCGVYLGDGLILHHLQNALSRREPLIRWQKVISCYLRHKDLNR